jgi:protein required for attachment to host cells
MEKATNGPLVRWYLVANRTEAVIYRDGKEKFLAVEHLLNPEGNKKEQQLDSDRQAIGVEHPKYAESAKKFGERICKMLAQNQNSYDELVLVAEPHFLGVLKNTLSDSILKRVSHQVNREYLDPAPQLRKKVLTAIGDRRASL